MYRSKLDAYVSVNFEIFSVFSLLCIKVGVNVNGNNFLVNMKIIFIVIRLF